MAERPQTSEKLVTFARHLTVIDADLMRCRLEAANIPAFVGNQSLVGMDWTLSNAVGGVKVLVRASDLEAARRVLELKEDTDESLTDGSSVAPEPADYGDPTEEEPEEAEFEQKLNAREELANRAFRSAVVGLIVFPLQIYVAWLLVSVLFQTEPMRSKYVKQAWMAAILCLPFAAMLCLFITTSLKS